MTGVILGVVIAVSIAAFARSDDPPETNPKREHALELYKQGKLVDAMPLLEELSSENPKDAVVMELPCSIAPTPALPGIRHRTATPTATTSVVT